MQLLQTFEKINTHNTDLDKIKKTTQKDLKDLKNEIESKNKEYEIINNKSSIDLKYNKDIFNITIDDNLNRKFSHSTEGTISDGDLEGIIVNQSGDKNIDKLQKILKAYGLGVISNEDLIKISTIMNYFHQEKIKTLENIQN